MSHQFVNLCFATIFRVNIHHLLKLIYDLQRVSFNSYIFVFEFSSLVS